MAGYDPSGRIRLNVSSVLGSTTYYRGMQDEVFLASEGDQYFERNRAHAFSPGTRPSPAPP